LIGVGAGLTGTVKALARFGSILYVGGPFINVTGGMQVNRIATWNGSSWSRMVDTTWNQFVYIGLGSDANVFASIGTDVYVGGLFGSIGGGGRPVNRITKWDTITSLWSPLGGTGSFAGVSGTGTVVSGLTIAPSLIITKP
jgi:hypothetical protein